MLPDKDWRTMDGGYKHCTGSGDQKHPQEKEMQQGIVVVQGSLTNNWDGKRKAKGKGEDIPIWMQSSKEYQGEIRKSS